MCLDDPKLSDLIYVENCFKNFWFCDFCFFCGWTLKCFYFKVENFVLHLIFAFLVHFCLKALVWSVLMPLKRKNCYLKMVLGSFSNTFVCPERIMLAF